MSAGRFGDADRAARAPLPQPASGRGERKVDLWLRRTLSDAHDEVLREGLPQAWLALIDKKLPQV